MNYITSSYIFKLDENFVGGLGHVDGFRAESLAFATASILRPRLELNVALFQTLLNE